MKRIVCWILIAALMVGFVSMIAFNASAQELTPDISIQTPAYGAGSVANLDGITVSVGTVDTAESAWWQETQQGSDRFTGTLAENGYYWLNLMVKAPAGTFHSEMTIFVNGEVHYDGWGCSGDGDFIEVYIPVDLRPARAEWVELGGLPEEILPGTATVPTLEVVDGYATVTDVRWLDEQKQAVSSFEDGKTYYLEVKLAPKSGYEFRDWFDAYGYYPSDSCEVLSATEGVALFRYSLIPSVGKITITSSGLGEGKPLSGVTAQVVGDAALAEIHVYNVTDGEMEESGNFEAGKNYQITYVLKSKAGLEFGKDVEVEANGNFGMEWHYDSQYLYVTEYFSTCKKIDKVEITVVEPKVGAKVADAKATLPKNAPYTANISWIDMKDYNLAEGTFQKGHRYQLGIDLTPAEGYVFTEDTQVLINGEEKSYGGFDASGLYGWAYNEYSFFEKITKVELPAMPGSIKKGDTLPTDFKVADNAKYTLIAQWGIMPAGGTPVKAEENGSYVLTYNVMAKDGYEFADDVAVTVGGKKYTGALNYGTEMMLFKAYNIGMKIIDKIELTVDAPNKGNTPKKPEFPKDVKYQCMEIYWGRNKTGNVMDDSTEVKTFEEGYYHFLSGILMAEEGYAFADQVDIYVNGKKMKTVAVANLGAAYQFAVSFGKLGKAGNADTGDTMPVGALVCLAAVALCGMAVTVAGKKKYCA